MKNLTLIIAIFFSTFFSAQKYSFDVKVTGKGQPIILIPGYSCSGEVWKETVEQLQKKYECHVLTLPGYAGIKPINEPILETVKTQIITYTKDKKLKNPILIGHSLGAFMSLWLASSEPNLYSKVIAVDGLPFISAMQDSTMTAEKMKANPMVSKETIIKNFENLPSENFIENTAKSMKWQVESDERAKQIATWQFNSDRKTLGVTIYELSTIDLRDEISKIKVPVLMLGSIYQTKENSEKIIKEQYKNVKNLTLHIADSKHFIMYDQPEWFYNEIGKFLK